MRNATAHSPGWMVTSLLALVVVACAPRAAAAPGDATSAPPASAGATETPAATASPGLSVAATETAYGTLALQTAKDAVCTADLSVYPQQLGDSPPKTLPAETANSAGLIRWSYDAPRIPSGTARFTATCASGSLTGRYTGTFSVDRPPMVATALTVRVTADAPPDVIVATVPSLAPLRDSSIARMKSTLATEWKSATRGLGGLQVVERSADITIFVAAAHGTSVNRLSSDGSEDIIVYVEGALGQDTVENAVATALHELGHIWCCHGPDADDGGHWKVKVRDPGLYGVDKYGLMTDPVTCVTFGALLSCPNRFSDREMTALGFTTFPPPAPDPCITQAFSLTGQFNTAKAQLAQWEAQLTSLNAQIRALEAQYPNGAPQSVINQYNALLSQYNSLVNQYNGLLERSRALAAQVNALPCDPS